MKLSGDHRGIALLITLLALAFLVAVTVQLNSSVNLQMQSAGSEQQLVQLEQMVLSGLNLARASLALDASSNKYDSTFDAWSQLGARDLSGLFGGGAHLKISVVDLGGRLQINSLVMTPAQRRQWQQEHRRDKGPRGNKPQDPEQRSRALWLRFLNSGRFAVEGEAGARALLDALIDWLDPDDHEHDRGAESSYYGGLNPPYACRNGPMHYLDELRLVKGFDHKVLYGDPDQGKEGILPYITVAGDDGRININTAPPAVLQALNGELTEEYVGELIAFREKKENKDALASNTWYRRVQGFPGDISLDPQLVSIRSAFFQVTCEAGIGRLHLQGQGIIQRLKKGKQVLLQWRVQ